MYILQRLTIVMWAVWILATLNGVTWLGIYLENHGRRVAASADLLAKYPEIMHWENVGKRWAIISLWIVVAAISYLVVVP